MIFSDVPSLTSIRLSEATLAAARNCEDFEVCGFVTAVDRPTKGPLERLKSDARRLLEATTGGGWPNVWNPNLQRLAEHSKLPYLVAEEGVNSSVFVERLHRDLQPDVILSYFATSIFKPVLLDSVSQAVNYHDGLLPHYAGLGATSHSIHRGESFSGYTFHRMTPGIDDGPILIQGKVMVTETATLRSVNRAKVTSATAEVPDLIDQIRADRPGSPQSGEGSYFSQAAYGEVTKIEDPNTLTAAELRLRVRAFGTLEVRIDGATEYVTSVASASAGDPLSFATSDGQVLKATRIADLPTALIRGRRRLRGKLRA
ncbi:MAG: formyltransferase family protein [Acidimicrobiales bacterium]